MQVDSSQLTWAAEKKTVDSLQAENLVLQELAATLKSQLDQFGQATSAVLLEQNRV